MTLGIAKATMLAIAVAQRIHLRRLQSQVVHQTASKQKKGNKEKP